MKIRQWFQTEFRIHRVCPILIRVRVTNQRKFKTVVKHFEKLINSHKYGELVDVSKYGIAPFGHLFIDFVVHRCILGSIYV